MSKHSAQITVRVTEETVARVNKLVEQAPWTATYGASVKASDVIREALRRGLDDLERELKKKQKQKP